MFKVMFKLRSSLNTSVADLTNFNRVELIPLSLMEFNVKVINELSMNKVQESIAYVAIVLI